MGTTAPLPLRTMKVLPLNCVLSATTLIGVLKKEFSSEYSYEIFGLGPEKSIIVRKSVFVGAQISVGAESISIQGLIPSKASWPLVLLDVLSSGGPLVASVFFGSSWKKLEKEIALFLHKQYGERISTKAF